MKWKYLGLLGICLLFLPQTAQAQQHTRYWWGSYYNPWYDTGDAGFYYNPYSYNYGISPDPFVKREFDRRLSHYHSHKFPMTSEQHELFHDRLNRDRYQDMLKARRWQSRYRAGDHDIPSRFYWWLR